MLSKLTWIGRTIVATIGVSGSVVLSFDGFWVKASALITLMVGVAAIMYNIGFNDGLETGVIEGSQFKELLEAKLKREKDETDV